MKFLFLSQGRKVDDQPDFDFAFRYAVDKEREGDFRNIPYLGVVDRCGWEGFYREVLRVNEDYKPDIVFFQFYHSGGDAGIAKCCRNLKASQNSPLIFGSIGDPFYTGAKKYFARAIHKSALDLAANADAFFSTSMGNVADELVAHGAKNLIFLPHAFCEAHFPYWREVDTTEKRYDVVMVGSRGRLITRKFVASLSNNFRRYLVVKDLQNHFGHRFTVFGRGWKGVSAGGFLPYKEQVRLFARSRVAVDAPAPILGTDYYASDRPFFILGSGTPLIMFHTPRFEKILKPEEQAFYVYNLRDVCSVCEKVLALPEDVIEQRRESVRQFVQERHLISHRIDTVLSTAEALMKHRRGDMSAQDALESLRLWHFLPEVDLREERKFAVRNWIG